MENYCLADKEFVCNAGFRLCDIFVCFKSHCVRLYDFDSLCYMLLPEQSSFDVFKDMREIIKKAEQAIDI